MVHRPIEPDEGKPKPRSRRGCPVRGDLLRSLRLERGWTREAAAFHAGVSDRLIYKAESGKSLDPRTVAKLAAAYSTDIQAIDPGDLICRAAPTDAGAILSQWVKDVWSSRRLRAVKELVATPFQYWCESGVIRTHPRLRARIRTIYERYGHFTITVEQVDGDGKAASCRWHLTPATGHIGLDQESVPHRFGGSCLTFARIDGGQILEVWEYLDPRLALTHLPPDGISDARSTHPEEGNDLHGLAST